MQNFLKQDLPQGPETGFFVRIFRRSHRLCKNLLVERSRNPFSLATEDTAMPFPYRLIVKTRQCRVLMVRLPVS